MAISIVSAPPEIGLDDNGILMSPEEFDAIEEYDDNYRYELVHGVLIVNPIPDLGERDPNQYLGHLLLSYGDCEPGASVLDLTIGEEYVRLPSSRRRADRVIWTGLGRYPDPKLDLPTIVVEFVSRRRRDRLRDYVLKRDEYLALGIREYWVIDRFQRDMTVFRPGPDGFEQQCIGEAETYRTPLLPGFELPLARLLGRADPRKQ